MKSARPSEVFGTVVTRFAPLRDSPTGRLDVRQYITAGTFTGYTRKGVSLSAEEFEALLEQPDAIVAALVGWNATEVRRR